MKDLPAAYVDGSVTKHKGLYYLGFAYYENDRNKKHSFITVPASDMKLYEAITKAETLALNLAINNGYKNIFSDNVTVAFQTAIPEDTTVTFIRKGNKAHKYSRRYRKILRSL